MKYTIKTYEDWTHPYFYFENDSRLIREKQTDEVSTEYLDLAVATVKDWLNAPDSEMTESDVRKEFDSETRKLEQKYVKQIAKYYNWRLNTFRKFESDVKNAKSGMTLRYDIPYEFNHFETEPSDDCKNEKQNEVYFEVSVKD